MKRFPKTLALVLAFACAFTVFAGAAFTDQDDIQINLDQNAWDVFISRGVINGYPDGSFRPNETVTRAQMAKMICKYLYGDDYIAAHSNSQTNFTDISGHWASAYIKFCQSEGIIAGRSSTRFAPEDTVTVLEAAKMLLVSQGYTPPSQYGLVGASWAANTQKLATNEGILENVKIPFDGPCSRQYALQMIYDTDYSS